ncbi:MAG: LacI family DNA-binding transcriptional regulator [Provencibacterium sp.]|nr:LacI family DNA-binding transcriptional regulator [Provencibacterium sp.]
MAVTSKEIAGLAGVSRGTVDRVLHNRPGVKAQTRERVEKIARQLGYVPFRAGRALSSARRAFTIGLILNCVGIRFYDEVLRGIEDCRAAYADFNLQLSDCRLQGYALCDQLSALDRLAEAKPDALLITPLNAPEVAQRIDRLVGEGIPVVTLNNDISGTRRMLYVGCNYFDSGRTAAGLMGLFTGGRGRAGLVLGSARMLGQQQREEGFRSELSLRCPQMELAGVIEGDDDDVRTYRQVLGLWERCGRLDALYFAAAGAYGGVSALEEICGGRMPAVIASDAVEETCRLILEGKVQATVCQQPYRQGYEALKNILEYLISGRMLAQEQLFMQNEIKIAQNLEG